MNFIGIKDLNHLIRTASISDEMREFFNKRTKEHIDRVKKYCKKIHNYDNNRFKELIDRSEEHDASKFENPEMDPYIYITWDYKCKRDGKPFDIPEDIKKQMNEATNHHIKHNRHHPEYHCNSIDKNMINRENRDAIPDKIIDATKMPELDISEMCADWMAMSEEVGGSPIDWAKKNINKRWKFDKKQEDLIYELLENIWNSED